MTGHSYDLLKQLKNSKIWKLILLESNCRLVRILPDESFIRMELMKDESCSLQFVEQENLTEEEIANALVIKGNSFGDDKSDKITILTREIETDGSVIHFNAYMNRLAIKYYQFRLKSELHYRVSYDTVTGEFMFEFKNNYENVENFMLNYMHDYISAMDASEVRTSLMSENADVLIEIRTFLANIGFDKIMKDKRMRFKTQAFGDRYLWDVLFRYLYLISIKPETIIHILKDNPELTYSLIFDVDSVSFYEMCKGFKEEKGEQQ